MATPMRDAEYEKRKDEAKLLIAAGGCSAIKFWSNTDATRLCPADHKKEVGLDPLEAPIYVSEWLEAAKKAVELISKGIALLEPAAPSSPSLDSLKTGVEDGFTKEEIALQKQHTEMLEDKLTRLDADYMMLVRQRVWMACEEHMPDEGGRYWCYCTEINDLGTSHFQWNCYYDPQNKSFSDEGHSISVTHWKPLAPPPISFPPIPSKEPGELDRVIESVAGDCPKREENSWYEKMKSEYKKGIIAAREVWFYVGKHITKEQYYEIVGQEVDGTRVPYQPAPTGDTPLEKEAWASMEKHRWDVMNPLRNDAMAYIQGYVNRAKEPTSPEYIDRMQEGEVPEEIGNWIEKEASRIANEPIIHEFQAARAGLIRMYKYLQPTYKQAIELLSDRCRELESQLSAYPPPTNTEQK